MARKSNTQVNIRSAFVRERVARLAAETGKTMTQVVEDAVRSYTPQPPADEQLPEGLVRIGKLLVLKSRGGPPITIEETNRWIEEDRDKDPFKA